MLKYHVEAEVHFLAPEEGGRHSPVRPGYRPQFYCEGGNWDAIHDYPGRDEVKPGETVVALLSFLSPEKHRGRVSPGLTFELREGARLVGTGKVLRVLEL
jgi:translation elongation factor EF-Tu-like GTPase